jgi:hypothetical protein
MNMNLTYRNSFVLNEAMTIMIVIKVPMNEVTSAVDRRLA